MTVQLVLGTGSNAGLTAPIHRGYYMIGRHPECQIRPKTRSVSRRHCLLHHDEGVFRVLDLGSTRGTQVNGEKIAPKRWFELADGDELRCGKTTFRVSVERQAVSALEAAPVQPQQRPETQRPIISDKSDADRDAPQGLPTPQGVPTPQRVSTPQPATPHSDLAPPRSLAPSHLAASSHLTASSANQEERASSEEAVVSEVNVSPDSVSETASTQPEQRNVSLVQGEAWQEFDVASFLESADLADREERYAEIRRQDAARKSEEWDDGDVFDDTMVDGEDGTLSDIGSRITAESATGSGSKGGKPGSRASTGTYAPPKKKKRTASSGRSIRLSFPSIGGGIDQWKMVAALLLAIGVGGYLTYSVYQFVQGPPPRVIKGID